MNEYSGYGYDSWSTGVTYNAEDPLFGAMPGTAETPAEETPAYGQSNGTGQGHDNGQWHGYDTGQPQAWETGLQTVYGYTGFYQQVQAVEADAYVPETETYEPVSYQTGTYGFGGYATEAYPAGAGYEPVSYQTGTYGFGGYATEAYAAGAGYEPGTYGPERNEPGRYESEPYEPATYGAEPYESAAYESEPYEAERYKPEQYEPERYEPEKYEPEQYEPGEYEPGARRFEPEPDRAAGPEPGPEPADAAVAAAVGAAAPSQAANRDGSRRRRPVKRSALLSVAIPSVAVVGFAACAAAAVAVTSHPDDSPPTHGNAGPPTTKAGPSKLDKQFAGVTRDALDFADRASRTQKRLDLKERQAAERRKKTEEAARKEALRPKVLLPVAQKGLSAYFGQAGVNWMSIHTGIDFPVSYGTPVRAATDGTVWTQWNASYGNMAKVTAPDGTETWYCHLSSAKIRSGSVKAGDVIAYSGNSGNSTGPHLHFEVHPDRGSAIDPLNWLLAKGLDPR